MEEVTVTDILVTEGILQGVTGALHFVEELPQGTEAGGAGHHLFLAVHVIEVDVIAEAVAQLVVVQLMNHIDLAPLLVRRGVRHLLGAGVVQNQCLPGNHNLHGKLVETTGQGHRPEVQMGRKVWFHMTMVLPRKAKGGSP